MAMELRNKKSSNADAQQGVAKLSHGRFQKLGDLEWPCKADNFRDFELNDNKVPEHREQGY